MTRYQWVVVGGFGICIRNGSNNHLLYSCVAAIRREEVGFLCSARMIIEPEGVSRYFKTMLGIVNHTFDQDMKL